VGNHHNSQILNVGPLCLKFGPSLFNCMWVEHLKASGRTEISITEAATL